MSTEQARVLGVGTVALDSVQTPAGSVDDVPGGSALYFGAAARHFASVALAGVIGEDFPEETLRTFSDHADTVKYSLFRPDPEKADDSFGIARTFVDNTRQAEEGS